MFNNKLVAISTHLMKLNKTIKKCMYNIVINFNMNLVDIKF